MIRLATFAASAALLFVAVTTGSALGSEAKSSDPAIDLCAHAETENAALGDCAPDSQLGAPLSATQTVLVDGCAGGDLHVVRYGGMNVGPVVATWCQNHP